jgi:hypothetical protein
MSCHLSVRWQKMALLFFSVGLCVGKNQMCHLRVGFFTLTDNGLQLSEVGDFEAQNCEVVGHTWTVSLSS